MSIANREDALKCLRKARICIETGDTAKARRFIAKSIHLYPTEEAKAMLSSFERGDTSNHVPKENIKPRHRQTTTEQPKVPVHDPNDEASRIAQMKDYYEILKVSKADDTKIIKKSYRKLALQFHPDKCQSPHAEAAFKMINKAYQCLSDEQSRAAYDQFGPDEERIRQAAPGRYSQREMDMTPEELFNFFFNGVPPHRSQHGFSFRSQTHPFRTHMPQRRQREGSESVHPMLVSFIPILLMILFSVISSMSEGHSSAYSLHRTHQFKVPRETDIGGFRYFVEPTFQGWYGRNPAFLRNLEHEVLVKKMEELRENCVQEKIDRGKEIEKAKGLRDTSRESALRAAYHKNLHSCKRMQDIFDSVAAA